MHKGGRFSCLLTSPLNLVAEGRRSEHPPAIGRFELLSSYVLRDPYDAAKKSMGLPAEGRIRSSERTSRFAARH